MSWGDVGFYYPITVPPYNFYALIYYRPMSLSSLSLSLLSRSIDRHVAGPPALLHIVVQREGFVLASTNQSIIQSTNQPPRDLPSSSLAPARVRFLLCGRCFPTLSCRPPSLDASAGTVCTVHSPSLRLSSHMLCSQRVAWNPTFIQPHVLPNYPLPYKHLPFEVRSYHPLLSTQP